jgi:ADP-ribose pyrophosphatase YjhB (NUDIX family)
VTDPVREYPDAPRVGVGAVVLDGDRVLLIRRGRPPAQGQWSLPGGLVRLGERLEDAVVREVEEECGLRVSLLGVCGVVDRIVPAGLEPGERSGAIRYHWVIVDYAASVAGGELRAGSDADDAEWVRLDALPRRATTAGIGDMVERAVRLRAALGSTDGGGLA